MPASNPTNITTMGESDVHSVHSLLDQVSLDGSQTIVSNKGFCCRDYGNTAASTRNNQIPSVNGIQRGSRDRATRFARFTPHSPADVRDAKYEGSGMDTETDGDSLLGDMRDFESPATYPLVRIKRKYLRRRYVNPMADNIAKAREKGRSYSAADVEERACIKHLQRESSISSQIAEKYHERARTFVKQASDLTSAKVDEQEDTQIVVRCHPRIPRKLKPLFHHPSSEDILPPALGKRSENVENKVPSSNGDYNYRRTYNWETSNKSDISSNGSTNSKQKRVHFNKGALRRPERPLPQGKESHTDHRDCKVPNSYAVELEARKALARKRLLMLKPMFATVPESTDFNTKQ